MSSVNFNKHHLQPGFTLVEMAIVMVILGFLLAGLITPLSSQREVSQREATERQLQEIRNALVGFAQANGRLPCPSLNGALFPDDGVAPPPPCPPNNNGVPYNTLGLQGTVINTALRDVWQRPIRYRLTRVDNWRYARPGLLPGTANPNFVVCNSSMGATATTCGNNTQMAQSVVAVILSEGADQFGSPDENQNTDAATDLVFIMHPPNGDFDDIVVWISDSTLRYEISRAGQ